MNIAALKALLEGRLDDFVTAMTPDGIVNQEKAGQVQFVAGDSLPKRMRGVTRSELEALGLVFGEDIDDLFVQCRLPFGWSKQATNHQMWSELLDEGGVVRASIFYKAAFYDRDAFLNWNASVWQGEE